MLKTHKKEEIFKHLDSFSIRKKEKNKNGEVFTKTFRVNLMLDKLQHYDPTIFTNESYTFLDPANGAGVFPICLYFRLMEGLKEKIPMRNKEEFIFFPK